MNSDTTVPRCQYIAGLNQTKKAVRAARVSTVYLADDADEHVRRQVLSLCAENDTAVSTGSTMDELGKRCGIDVGCAVCAELC
ncbi:MAG: ribosomal L7Ae/L30e/S12e/Gadd45 family protein [Clostridia bacterium]|nr:ribosomal L7Ae/L30e/S12e/Gadd45 family protein [Clostridia bacterium]